MHALGSLFSTALIGFLYTRQVAARFDHWSTTYSKTAFVHALPFQRGRKYAINSASHVLFFFQDIIQLQKMLNVKAPTSMWISSLALVHDPRWPSPVMVVPDRCFAWQNVSLGHSPYRPTSEVYQCILTENLWGYVINLFPLKLMKGCDSCEVYVVVMDGYL